MVEFRKAVGTSGLFFASIGAVVGSGWLFGSLYAAQLAGPASILSWIIAGFCVLILALIFAELASLFPISGGLVSFPYFSHGNLTGFLLSWITWISFVILTPIEVQAAIQYISVFVPGICYKSENGVHLLFKGYVFATILMILILYVNAIGVKFMAKANKYMTIWKIAIPALVVVVFLFTGANVENLGHNFETFSPYGFKGVFSALAIGGVIFSFNGFQHAIMLSAETKDPQKSIPRAIALSIFACLALYLSLQIAFLLKIGPETFQNGWANLHYEGDSGPLVGLASLLGLTWLVYLLYFDAFLSPTGAGVVYCASASRLVYAMSAHSYMPKALHYISKKGVPSKAMIANFLIGMLMFLPFSGWQSMVAFLSSTLILSYAIGPIALFALRHQIREKKRPFKLPFYKLACLFAFFISNMMLFWTGWHNLSKLIVVIVIGFFVFFLSSLINKKFLTKHDYKAGWWLIPYIGGMGLISYLGEYGGTQVIAFGYDFLVIAIFSLILFILSQTQALPKKMCQRNIEATLRDYGKNAKKTY